MGSGELTQISGDRYMYAAYFGLTQQPFELSPDARYFYGSQNHARALAHLTYGLAQGEGVIVITGEVGAGKTTLIEHLVFSLDPQRYTVGTIATTQLAPAGVLRTVLSAFGISRRGREKADMLHQLGTFFREQQSKGMRLLLIVDEVQNLPFASLEELRMLANLAIGTGTPLQTCLVGQPEFRDIIMSARAEQLRQRVVTSYHLGSLPETELRRYIEHRLRVAGWSENPIFDDDVFSIIYAYTNGIPRRVNLLCSRLLLQAYLDEKPRVNSVDANLALDEWDMEINALAGVDTSSEAGAPIETLNFAHRFNQLEARVDKQTEVVKGTLDILHRYSSTLLL
jgi:general secretion pathway protein A